MKRSPVSATARPLESHAPQPTAPSRAEAVLRWLVPLRFLSAAGQVAALAIARVGLDLPLPYERLWIVPALVVLTNVGWMALRGRSRATAAQLVVPTLVLDAALFTLLLQWTGGPDSPFSALYIIQIVLAAMTGSRGATWIVAFACAAFYALVFPWSAPAHFWHAPAFAGSSIGLHALGMWVAVVVVAAVMTFFMTRIIETLGEREDEMRKLGELAARNTRLASLTTLAAGAAHELGSPLGTIAVIARELERAASASGGAAQAGLAEDAKLLRTEVERCRAILDRMRARAAHEVRESERPIAASELESALREGLDPAEAGRVRIAVHAPPAAAVGARVDFCEVVGPILRNALDASVAGGPVDVDVRLDAGRLETCVRDRGTGMDEMTLRHVGEPFFTTRSPGQGTGLGLFVVHLHLERLGGSLRFESTPGEGTTARVAWPIAGMNGGGTFGEGADRVRDVA